MHLTCNRSWRFLSARAPLVSSLSCSHRGALQCQQLVVMDETFVRYAHAIQTFHYHYPLLLTRVFHHQRCSSHHHPNTVSASLRWSSSTSTDGRHKHLQCSSSNAICFSTSTSRTVITLSSPFSFLAAVRSYTACELPHLTRLPVRRLQSHSAMVCMSSQSDQCPRALHV
jgi:hypothetical protein